VSLILRHRGVKYGRLIVADKVTSPPMCVKIGAPELIGAKMWGQSYFSPLPPKFSVQNVAILTYVGQGLVP